MAGNKYIIADRGRLLRSKLEQLSKKLQGSLSSVEFETQEALLFEAIKIINSFYNSLQGPQLDLTELTVRADDMPDPKIYNDLWDYLLNDLITVFSELENLEVLTLANFNLIITETNRLTARLKSVSSKLGDYILYSLNPTKDALFFKDSFNDQSKIDVNSDLLNTNQCNIDQAQGIITLPVDTSQNSAISIKKLPIINPASNGVVGNNQELNKSFNGSLSVLLDNNPDTWFEYERVVSSISDNKEPLILDLTINIGEEKVLNYIRINPNNFGTKTIIKIDAIETSIDGKVYTSIKNDIPIADFVQEDEAEVFNLAPSTSKYAGQGIYTFTARKVKYVHIVFKQTEPYIISTSAGDRLRYAIGIRDIDLRAFSFLSNGELISLPFKTIDEIRKAAISANQNPNNISELVGIQYFLSPDDGATYHELRPKELEGVSGILSTPEILEFNGSSVNTIKTAVPVSQLRLKIALTRNDELFTKNSSFLSRSVKTKSEVHSVPQEAPFQIDLLENPIDDSVVVVDPLFGSRGIKEAGYIINRANDQIDSNLYRLPFKTWPRPVKKASDNSLEAVAASEWIHVEVGGEEWTQTTSVFSGTNKEYSLDLNRGELKFGNGTAGAKPAANQPIVIYMDAEKLFPSAAENNHLAKLDFYTSANKDGFIIKRYDEPKMYTEILPKKVTIIKLTYDNITDLGNIDTVFTGTRRTFINGKEELVADTDWSIDTEKGIIFLKTATSSTEETIISYIYQPIHTLTINDWNWGTTSILRDSISIKETAWKTRVIEEQSVLIEADDKVIGLPDMSIVKNSLLLNLTGTVTDATNPFLKEVDFIDGKTELNSKIVKTIEKVPTLVPVSNVSTFTLGKVPSLSSSSAINFSNTSLFSTDVGVATPSSPGEYSVDSSGVVKVYTSRTYTIKETGEVNYFTDSPTYKDNGLYSVDYRNGMIYTQREFDKNSEGDWELFVSYEYTDFRAEYKIARFLSGDSYEVDITNGIIEFKDTEITKHSQIPKQTYTAQQPYYIVNYDYIDETREYPEELVNYYTPVVKDYALKIITKGQIF